MSPMEVRVDQVVSLVGCCLCPVVGLFIWLVYLLANVVFVSG